MKHTLLARFTNIQSPIRERRPTKDGRGFERVVVGYRTAIVEVVVDMEMVRGLAGRAAANKTRKATVGPISATARFIR